MSSLMAQGLASGLANQQAGLAQQQALAQAYNNQYISAATSATTNTVWVNIPTTGTTTTTAVQGMGLGVVRVPLGPDINLNDGRPHTIIFPDGTIIDVKANGSFEIRDEDAKVVYKANRSRDFNPFINASDKLEAFIKFCGDAGVRQGDVLAIPIKHFIGWLILEAAKADNEPEPDVLLLPDLRRAAKPQCLTCGRFISPQLTTQRVEFCRAACFETRLLRCTPTALTPPVPHPVENIDSGQSFQKPTGAGKIER